MDKKAYIIAKNSSVTYVDEVLDGVTLINGANCEIDSITPSADGRYVTVVFSWTGTSTGQKYTSEMKVYNGVGIKDMTLNSNNHLIVTYTDDTIKDLGQVPVPTVEVGTTTTVDYDQPAEVIQETTATGIRLNFKIPKGQPGGADPQWIIE